MTPVQAIPRSSVARGRPLTLSFLLLVVFIVLVSVKLISEQTAENHPHAIGKRQFQAGALFGETLQQSEAPALQHLQEEPIWSPAHVLALDFDDESTNSPTDGSSSAPITTPEPASNSTDSSPTEQAQNNSTGDSSHAALQNILEDEESDTQVDSAALLSSLSNMVDQLSEVDSDTARNLTDSVLGAMNPDSSVVPGVEQAVESQIANIVPPVIPAIADLLDEDMNHDPILEGSNVEGALNNVVHQGKSIIDQITNGNDVNIDPELRALLDEVSGIVDTTEGQLQSPVCVVSSAINGVPTQVVVPCVDAGADATTTVIQLAPSAYSNPPDAATVVVPSHPVENSDAPQSEPVQAPPQIPQDPSSATSEPAQDLPPPSQSSGSSEPPLDQDVTQPPPDQGSSPALPAPEIPRPSLDQTDVQRPPAQETSPPPPVQDPAQPPPNQHDAQPSEVQNVPQPWPTAPQPSTQDPVIPDDNQKSWPIPSDLPTEPLPNPVQPDIDGQPPSSASVVLPSSQQSVAPIDSPNTDGGTSAGAPAVPQWPLPGDTESQPTGTLPGSKPLQDGTPTTPNNPGAVDSAPETCAGDFDASNPACSSTIPNDSLNCGFLHGPCNGRRGFKCNECLNGWFCPPMETPAQVAPCGLGWPCYHCADGWFCASDEVLDSQNLQNTIASSPADGNTVGGAGTVSQAGAAETNDYLYLGCFQGGASRSLLGSVPVDYLSGTMSTMICVNHCFERGYTFAGTENGHECWCGETLRVDAVKLPESSCQLPCHGHQNSICGGQGAMSLFADPEEV